jgi:ribosomal protein S18 acetylase RimI-like enzyme
MERGSMVGESSEIKIIEAKEEDWPWIKASTLELVMSTIGPERLKRVGEDKVKEMLDRHYKTIHENQSMPDKAFISYDREGRKTGVVWVARIQNQFTGDPEAFIIDLFVPPEHREKNIGRALIRTAENYARGEGLHTIALSVGAHNSPARALYDSEGYCVESMRMTKKLVAGEDGRPCDPV